MVVGGDDGGMLASCHGLFAAPCVPDYADHASVKSYFADTDPCNSIGLLTFSTHQAVPAQADFTQVSLPRLLRQSLRTNWRNPAASFFIPFTFKPVTGL